MRHLIEAHIAFVDDFVNCIDTYPDSDLTKFATSDDLCCLGKWIYENQSNYHLHDDFRKLKDAHYVFHEYATRALHLVSDGSRKHARYIVDTDMREISKIIVGLLEKLQ